ncbi:efflux RND transporter periplasmic adaptor subunit [Caulobacter henricii]|uniref:RND transporter n=1 Tax=Caulobacter henricii TaxID=69395 RepID=A0A0N7JHS6_9CAUL|nr:efflux RND transporter periplasmic adaptor subunit [Caulobacter henricii]ALL14218.1 RND transporter [Caulobacter henricii]
MRSSALVVVLVLGAFTVSGCGADKKPKQAKAPAAVVATQTVSIASVVSQSVPREINASGTISPWEEVVVGAETGGLTAMSVSAEEGQTVQAGQVLVKLNDTLLSAQLRQQDASVASARVSLAEAEAALNRARELQAKGYLSQASLDSSLARQQTASAQVAAAEAGRGETAARLAQTAIRAPVSGLISRRTVTKGQIVGTGAEVFRIVRDSRLELDAEVPETDLLLVRPGMPARIISDKVGETSGRVRIVTSEVNGQTRLGIARVSLSGMGGFRPGMFARATIQAGDQPALTVPSASVLYRENRPGVFVLDAKNHAHFRRIAIVAATADRIAATGLTAGERVVVEGAGFLGEGDAVRIGSAVPSISSPAKSAR